MNRRHFIGLALGSASVSVLGTRFPLSSLEKIERSGWAFGTKISLTAYHQTGSVATAAIDEAFNELDEIEKVLSLYRPQSQLCKLNNSKAVTNPHPYLVTVLQRSLEWAEKTRGAFDPTVQPLWTLHKTGRSSDESLIRAALKVVDWKKVNMSMERIELGEGQELTFNGIAQGFAADRVKEVLLKHGIKHAMVNTGEYLSMGAKANGDPWRIGIQHPRVQEAYATLADLKDAFLATSGDYETTFAPDFSRHHIFNPRTGRCPGELSSVTVVARTGVDADALSTAIFVLGAEQGMQLARKLQAVELFLVFKDGQTLATPNFPRAV